MKLTNKNDKANTTNIAEQLGKLLMKLNNPLCQKYIHHKNPVQCNIPQDTITIKYISFHSHLQYFPLQ